MEKSFKMFLDDVLADPIPDIGRKELESTPDKLELVESGEANSSQDELCVSDLVVECKPRYLKDHLPIFAPAEEIIKMEKVFKEKPELRHAERSDDGDSESSCDSCKANSGCSGSTGQEKKD